MSKYIDADRFRMELEKRLKNVRDYMNGAGMKYKGPKYFRAQGRESAYDALLNTIDSLQQEQPIGEEYAIEIGKHTHTLRVGSQSDIDNLIRQEKQEQPDVDLEKAIQDWMINECGPSDFNPYADHWCADDIINTARHFAEWGAEHLADASKMISDDLEEAAWGYASKECEKDAFKAGAKWMEARFEHCGTFPIEDQRGGYWPTDYYIKKK